MPKLEQTYDYEGKNDNLKIEGGDSPRNEEQISEISREEVENPFKSV